MFYIQATDGVKIAVYDYNSCGKRTVFLIHGWPLSHKIYEYQIPRLIDCGYRVVAIDLVHQMLQAVIMDMIRWHRIFTAW